MNDPRSSVASFAVASLLALGLAACGGGKGDSDTTPASSNAKTTATAPDAPQPAETAQAYADRWAKAIRTKDCTTLTDIYGYGPEQAPKACADLALTELATEANARKRWAHACASITASSGFTTY